MFCFECSADFTQNCRIAKILIFNLGSLVSILADEYERNGPFSVAEHEFNCYLMFDPPFKLNISCQYE